MDSQTVIIVHQPVRDKDLYVMTYDQTALQRGQGISRDPR
jgi:hypothetical protein